MKRQTAIIRLEQKRITAAITRQHKKYYLTGGTALAFYFNHRLSEDLDFFTQSYEPTEPDRILREISETAGYRFHLEQSDPRLVPMKIYTLEVGKGIFLKVDFVQDFTRNLRPIRDGLHSLDDIYYRKLCAAVGGKKEESPTGQPLPSGRQSAKDVFDLHTLSERCQTLPSFFMRHFSDDQAERLIAWWRGFDRLRLKLELADLAPRKDPARILKDLDEKILKKLPARLL